MIHGTVGSGKSIFLQLLLGVIKPSKGNVSVLSKEISLAAQKPWIQNQTIRENVIGLSPVDEFLSKEIIYGCALGVDILEFPSGDQKMAGTDGCNLSGRQKQRLVTLCDRVAALRYEMTNASHLPGSCAFVIP